MASDVPAVKDIGNPLDEIGDLMEKTLSILNTSGGDTLDTLAAPGGTQPAAAATPTAAPAAAGDPLLDLLGPTSPQITSTSQNDAMDLLGPTTPATPPTATTTAAAQAAPALAATTSLTASDIGAAGHDASSPSPPLKLQSQDLDLLGTSTSVAQPVQPAQHQISLDNALSSQFEEQSLADPEPDQQSVSETVEEVVAVSPGPSPSLPAIPPPEIMEARPTALRAPSFAGSAEGSAAPSDGVRVWVKDPEKVETQTALGIKSHYVTYLVRTESTLPSMRADGLEVRRRFSDFDVLHKMLKRTHRGYFVPPLPEKSYIEGKIARNEFVRLRRADLQAFLRACAAHPVVRESEPMKLFLLQQGDLSRNPAWLVLLEMMQQPVPKPRAASAASDASQDGHSGGLGGLLGMNAGWMTWMRQNVFTPPKRELSDEEKELLVAKELLQDLERLLELSCNTARNTCQHLEQVASDMHEFGRNLAMLSRFEEAVRQRSGQYTEQGFSAAKRAEDLQKVAMCHGRQSSLWKSLSIKSAASLVTLHDYYVLVPEAVAALEEREKALDEVVLLEDDLLYKKHQLEQLQTASKQGKNVTAAEKKTYQLTQMIGQLEESVRVAKEQYEVIKMRNRQELARFGLDREADFRAMLHAFASVQAQHVQAQADMWASLVRQMEGREDAPPPQ